MAMAQARMEFAPSPAVAGEGEAGARLDLARSRDPRRAAERNTGIAAINRRPTPAGIDDIAFGQRHRRTSQGHRNSKWKGWSHAYSYLEQLALTIRALSPKMENV
jgi:hypothetical protein